MAEHLSRPLVQTQYHVLSYAKIHTNSHNITHKQFHLHFPIPGASQFTMPPNQREIQRQLMKKYNIIFDGPIDSISNPQWPSNCNTIFDHIRRLGKTDYSEYRESISADFTRFPWRHQVHQRAKRIT